MNYMEQVAQMLGVELEEEFNIDRDKAVYKFTEHGLLTYSKENQNWMRTYGLLEKLLTGWTEIIKKPILDEVEREYLSNVIKPFRDRVEGILKYTTGSYAYIEITYRDYAENIGCIYLPSFKKDTMYKGMETGKKYSLEDLGL